MFFLACPARLGIPSLYYESAAFHKKPLIQLLKQNTYEL